MNSLIQAVPVAERASRPRLYVWQGVVIAAMMVWIYASILLHLATQWWQDPNFSHGVFVPIFSGFLLWRDREKLIAIPKKPASAGLLIIGFALLVLVIGVTGAELFLARVSLVLLIAGLVVFFFGWGIFRAVLLPWAFLFLMIPIPAIIFNQITFPLQMLASRIAADVLPLFGVPVLREGNIIQLPRMPLEIAQACSGIRSLLSLATLSIIYGALLESSIWIRTLLALASLPIAVVANSFRIVGAGLLVQYANPEMAEGFFHTFSGWVIFVASLAMLYVLHKLLDLSKTGPGDLA